MADFTRPVPQNSPKLAVVPTDIAVPRPGSSRSHSREEKTADYLA